MKLTKEQLEEKLSQVIQLLFDDKVTDDTDVVSVGNVSYQYTAETPDDFINFLRANPSYSVLNFDGIRVAEGKRYTYYAPAALKVKDLKTELREILDRYLL